MIEHDSDVGEGVTGVITITQTPEADKWFSELHPDQQIVIADLEQRLAQARAAGDTQTTKELSEELGRLLGSLLCDTLGL